ncbi:MAG: metallophosphoesterase [Lachnospiraceae bacterium]|nr:metallophosphoesterase [Lachnospiraceae bacterium]
MKIKRVIIVLLQLLLLLACFGIVYLLGVLTPKHPDREPTGSTAIIEETQIETPSNADWETAGDEESRANEADSEDGGQDGQTQESASDGKNGRKYGRKYGRSKTDRAWTDRGQREAAGDLEAEPEKPYDPPRIMLASDLHYMSRTTHDDGTAFQKMLEGDDGKASQYSDEMIDALLTEALEQKPTALVLSGDITLNGERENHVYLAEKLHNLQEAGVQVVVIPGNHDINNKDAATYFGTKRTEAEYLESGEDFLELYHEFGYDQSPSRDPASLSYMYPLDATHWLLMLDSCQYEDRNHVEGRLKPETLAWLEAHLKLAGEHGIQILPIAHHNLLSESRLYTTQCTLENGETVRELLEKYQTPLYISGHLHAQRIKRYQPAPGLGGADYNISEIVLSPYSIAPNQYGWLSWNLDGGMKFETRSVDVAAYAAARGSENPELLKFDTWSEHFLKNVIRGQISKKIELVPLELGERMAELYADLYYDYCAGNAMSRDRLQTASIYKVWERVAPKGIYTAQMQAMIKDVVKDQHDWEYHWNDETQEHETQEDETGEQKKDADDRPDTAG